jgi:hypothetical protein
MLQEILLAMRWSFVLGLLLYIARYRPMILDIECHRCGYWPIPVTMIIEMPFIRYCKL